jgi:hypothetical protein
MIKLEIVRPIWNDASVANGMKGWGLMSEQDKKLASNFRKIPNRKERRQISFRVSDDEFTKLQKQSAETLGMSVPNFVKKKAQGSRLISPKFDMETRQIIARNLSQMGNNMNQIAKYCHTHQDENIDWQRLNYNIEQLRKEVSELWQQLN